MKNCETILNDIADVSLHDIAQRLKDIYCVLVFFKIVVIVCLGFVAIGFLLWLASSIMWFYMLSQLFK